MNHAGSRRQRPKVVVVGGGFAGLSAVRQLSVADVDVLLVDRNGYTTFQPLLYQVATGGLNPGDVTFALRAFTAKYRNTRFRRATVTKVDPDAKLLHVDEGDPIAYDYLIVCCGVTANHFGIPGAEEHSHTIYTRGAAIDARDLIVSSLEDAAQGQLDAKEPVFVVVGGGATGVEMAGTLAELRNGAVPIAYPDLDVSRVKVVMVEMSDDVLGPFQPKLRRYAARALRHRGIDLRLDTAVKQVHPDSVVVQRKGEEPETIPAAVTIWATGVTAGPVVGDWGLPTGKGGRIEVDPDLRVKGHPEIFAVGDVAVNPDDPLPQLAPPAIQGGKHAGVQIRRILAGSPTEPFTYHDKGTMATIGRSDAVVQLPNGFRLKGWPAWLAWLGLHLVELMGGRNRIASLINLSVRYLSWPSLNIVVGDHVD
ncbi:MAG TPA: NAD(P)/FAD-dependent oxidoreductase [Actinomycetales bacterium]|nr:NAD(P)/FAD-dependent oxidoreductase [Actinomycetales bacterium]